MGVRRGVAHSPLAPWILVVFESQARLPLRASHANSLNVGYIFQLQQEIRIHKHNGRPRHDHCADFTKIPKETSPTFDTARALVKLCLAPELQRDIIFTGLNASFYGLDEIRSVPVTNTNVEILLNCDSRKGDIVRPKKYSMASINLE